MCASWAYRLSAMRILTTVVSSTSTTHAQSCLQPNERAQHLDLVHEPVRVEVGQVAALDAVFEGVSRDSSIFGVAGSSEVGQVHGRPT
jgi:hypothetical protein